MVLKEHHVIGGKYNESAISEITLNTILVKI
jgi:hypothetical protein